MSRARPPRKGLLAALAATLVALGTARDARAVNITFDPDGAGANVAREIQGLDYLPGNSAALDVVDGGIFTGATFTNVFQSKLGAVTVDIGGNSTIIGLNGLDANANGIYDPGSFEITVVARFLEQVDGLNVTATGAAATFHTISDPGNFLRIYYDDLSGQAVGTAANELTGLGFDDGLQILNAFIGTGADEESSFRVTFATVRDLDQTDGNQGPPAQQTLGGTGDFNLLAGQVLSYNPAFFQSLDLSKIITSFTTDGNLTTLFNNVRPSPVVDGEVLILGAVNGSDDPALGDVQDFLFKSDANQSFDVAAVPEPGTMVLAFTGLVTVSLGSIRKLRRRTGSPAA